MPRLIKSIYRKCNCGETAHDAHWSLLHKGVVWACRNCGEYARDRNGKHKVLSVTKQINADTITDEQVREEIISHPTLVLDALRPNETGYRFIRRRARERLATIINNRKGPAR